MLVVHYILSLLVFNDALYVFSGGSVGISDLIPGPFVGGSVGISDLIPGPFVVSLCYLFSSLKIPLAHNVLVIIYLFIINNGFGCHLQLF